MEDATGVIANFSGGEDLSLYEVGEAIGHIREMVGEDIDVVMGISNDTRMHDRAQVILIVTGLGAKSLDEILPANEGLTVDSHPENVDNNSKAEIETILTRIDRPGNVLPTAAINNLDIPAFMRKKARQGLTPQAGVS